MSVRFKSTQKVTGDVIGPFVGAVLELSSETKTHNPVAGMGSFRKSEDCPGVQNIAMALSTESRSFRISRRKIRRSFSIRLLLCK